MLDVAPAEYLPQLGEMVQSSHVKQDSVSTCIERDVVRTTGVVQFLQNGINLVVASCVSCH